MTRHCLLISITPMLNVKPHHTSLHVLTMSGLSIFILLAALLVLPSGQAVAVDQQPEPAAAAPAQQANTKDALPPGERLLKDFKKSYGITLGAKADAPLLIVAMTPTCPNCKLFWKGARDSVSKGALRVRLYPAGIKDSLDEHTAALLLQASDPLKVWNQYVDGNTAALIGKPSPQSIEHVRDNTALINRWHFPVAPYIVYRAKNGQVKVVQGAPAKLEDVLNDAGPEKPESKP